MSKIQRSLIVTTVLALLFVLPTAALANKKVYQARLTTGAELHQVVGSSAVGSATFGTNPNGSLHFVIQVRNLSGAPMGAHIHAPADTTQNAPVLIPLCGNPSPNATGAACPFDPSTGTMYVEGDITSNLLAQRGVTPAALMGYLDGGLAYVNVHTALNPAGEARGQIYPR
jgi:Cu/Zn superoxide dismutase